MVLSDTALSNTVFFSRLNYDKKSCNIFIIKKLWCYHFFIVEIIAESVNLAQISTKKIIITMMENNYFFIKKCISNHRAKRRMFLQSLNHCFILLQKTKNSKFYLIKAVLKRTSNAIIQNKLSSLGWIVIEQVNYNNTTFRLHFQKEIVLSHLQSLFERSNHDVFWENEGKIHEGGCVKECFFRKVSGWHLAISSD